MLQHLPKLSTCNRHILGSQFCRVQMCSTNLCIVHWNNMLCIQRTTTDKYTADNANNINITDIMHCMPAQISAVSWLITCTSWYHNHTSNTVVKEIWLRPIVGRYLHNTFTNLLLLHIESSWQKMVATTTPILVALCPPHWRMSACCATSLHLFSPSNRHRQTTAGNVPQCWENSWQQVLTLTK